MDLKAFLLKNVDAERFYRSEIEGFEPGQNALCPFHDDTNPSFGVNLEKQGTFKCYTCNAYGTSWIGFYAKKEGLDDNFGEALRQIYHKYVRPIVPQEEIDDWHTTLMDTPSVLEWLEQTRGIRRETVEKFKLGWDGSSNRITIPIETIWGFSVNVRKYAPWRTGIKQPKVISYAKGYGGAYVYPVRYERPNEPVHIFEGELDAILAQQCGLNALTSTGGAGGGHDLLVDNVRTSHVGICYDSDEAGQSNAESLGQAFRNNGVDVRLVQLPVEDTGEDFTDFIVKYGYNAKNYLALYHQTEVLEGDRGEQDQELTEVSLYRADQPEYFGKRLSLTGHVVGKSIRPHEIPTKMHITCASKPEKMCSFCLANGAYHGTFTVDPHDPTSTAFVGKSTAGFTAEVRRRANCGGRCQLDIEVEQTHPMEEVTIVPELDSESSGAEYVLRSGFTIGAGLQANAVYRFVGQRILDPRDSTTSFLFHEHEAATDSIDSFTLTDELHRQLEGFQVASNAQAIEKAQESRYSDYAQNITHIYGRRNLHEAIDLVFYSPLSFEFNGEYIRKGWLEALIVGDTRTGKNYVGEGLQRFYQLGDVASGENASFAGLVGGVQQIGSGRTWSITWGLIPRNDRRLVILDEVSSLPLADIARMSRIRSEGIAEVVKIHAERTRARTRLIWMGNPRENKQIRDYSYGIQAIPPLIGAAEDVARFDYALVVGHGDVDFDIINSLRPSVNGAYEIEKAYINRQLILWVWSRTQDQIKFTDQATNDVMKVVRAFARGYHSSIPLVQAETFAQKVAKIAAAVAGRTYSTEDGNTLLVDSQHIRYAAEFIHRIYSSDTSGYQTYSKLKIYAEQIKNYDALEEAFQYYNTRPIITQLLQRELFNVRDLQEIIGEDSYTVRELIRQLLDLGFIRPARGGYYGKTPDAIRWLRQKI